jgi:hypothetical protein
VLVDSGGWSAAAGALDEAVFPSRPASATSLRTPPPKTADCDVQQASRALAALEERDPDQEFGGAIALPPNAQTKPVLAAPRWELTSRGIKVKKSEKL